MKHRNMRTVVRVGLLPAGIAVALAPALAFAQESGKDATTLDKIEVTGSRIRQVDKETAAPVLTMTRQDIEKQGFSSVADIIQNISAAGSPAISRADALSSGEAVGGQYIDLRNLGASRTLILVDGKRLGITTGGLQDISQIPASMVERIDVLKDGASTIYGSDAIAGVINIITRKNYEGAQASAYLGQYDQGDGERQVYDFVTGFTGEKGSLTAGIEYSKEKPVWARDRWFSEVTFPTGEKTDPRPGGLSGTNQFGTMIDASGASWNLIRDGKDRDATDFANYRRRNASDVSNSNEQMTVATGIERRSLFVNGTYKISDNVDFDASALYSDRDSFQQIAGYPYQSKPAGGQWHTPMPADSYYNPLGSWQNPANPQDVEFIRRGWDVPRESRNSVTTFRFVGALSGTFETGEHYWDWDAGYLYNQNEGKQQSTGNLNTANVARAVGPSFLNALGQVQCGTSDNPIPLGVGGGMCTPWNPMVPAGIAGQGGLADANVQAYLYQPGQALSETTTKAYFANLSGSLAHLPAGDLGMAVGVEHRSEGGAFSPDALSQTGVSTDLASGPTSGGYSLDEIYGELLIPILADVAGAKELGISLASRYSDYDTFGDTTNSKFGFTWKPIEQLLVRGTWSQGFRAPTIADLYGGTSDSFENYTDPCDTKFGAGAGNAACLADVPAGFRQRASTPDGLAPNPGYQSNLPFKSGSNPNLMPETSVSKTFGLVWSPGFAEGLNMSLDWWHIRIDDRITDDTPTTMLNDCYLRGLTSRCQGAGRFTRDPVTGAIASLSYGGRNAGYQETEGYDFDLSYTFDASDFGRFGIDWQSTYVDRNELKTDDSSNPPQQLNGFDGNFRLRSNMVVSWDKGDWGASWSMRYYSGTKEQCAFDDRCSIPEYTAPEYNGEIVPMTQMGANTFHDLQVRWAAPWNATVSVGANNVFDHYAAPAYGKPNSSFSYYGGFDIGRFWYLKYQQRF